MYDWRWNYKGIYLRELEERVNISKGVWFDTESNFYPHSESVIFSIFCLFTLTSPKGCEN